MAKLQVSTHQPFVPLRGWKRDAVNGGSLHVCMQSSIYRTHTCAVPLRGHDSRTRRPAVCKARASSLMSGCRWVDPTMGRPGMAAAEDPRLQRAGRQPAWRPEFTSAFGPRQTAAGYIRPIIPVWNGEDAHNALMRRVAAHRTATPSSNFASLRSENRWSAGCQADAPDFRRSPCFACHVVASVQGVSGRGIVRALPYTK